MSEGMIRCLALLRVMGDYPVVTGLGSDPHRDESGRRRLASADGDRKRGGSLAPMLVLIASLAAAFLFAYA